MTSFLRHEFTRLQLWLTPNRWQILWAYHNVSNLVSDHYQLVTDLLEHLQAAFPADITQLLDRAGADNFQDSVNLLIMLIERYRSLGLPPYINFNLIQNYIQWLEGLDVFLFDNDRNIVQ